MCRLCEICLHHEVKYCGRGILHHGQANQHTNKKCIKIRIFKIRRIRNKLLQKSVTYNIFLYLELERECPNSKRD